MNIARDAQYQVCVCGLISKLFLEVWAVWIQKRAVGLLFGLSLTAQRDVYGIWEGEEEEKKGTQ
jgi:hypothetical protein